MTATGDLVLSKESCKADVEGCKLMPFDDIRRRETVDVKIPPARQSRSKMLTREALLEVGIEKPYFFPSICRR